MPVISRTDRTRKASAQPPKDSLQLPIPRPLPIPKHAPTKADPLSPMPPAPSVPRAAQGIGFTLPDRLEIPRRKSSRSSKSHSPRGMFFAGHGLGPATSTPQDDPSQTRHSLPARPRHNGEGHGTIRAVPPELSLPRPSMINPYSIGPAFARREAARRITPPSTPPIPAHVSTQTPTHPLNPARIINENRESTESSGTYRTEHTDGTEGAEVSKGVKALDDISYDEEDQRLRLFSASSWSLALQKRNAFKRVKNALRAFSNRRKHRPTISTPVLHEVIPRPSTAWEMPHVPLRPAHLNGESLDPEGHGARTIPLEHERDKHAISQSIGLPTGSYSAHNGHTNGYAARYPREYLTSRTGDHNNGQTNKPANHPLTQHMVGFVAGPANGRAIQRTNGHASEIASFPITKHMMGQVTEYTNNIITPSHKREATFGQPTARIPSKSNNGDRGQSVYSASDVGTVKSTNIGNRTVRRKPVPTMEGQVDVSDVIMSRAFPDARPLMRARSVPHRPDGRMIGTSLPPPPRKYR
ncbi:hypothetical protein CcaverHIS002_0200730 [Cutaneotrichosporon cavernicola]|nr:hypothetical protein CcaverHIS002_0200730 [Cutaneotrichosporon cavernicola]